jgi:hypothetical protein
MKSTKIRDPISPPIVPKDGVRQRQFLRRCTGKTISFSKKMVTVRAALAEVSSDAITPGVSAHIETTASNRVVIGCTTKEPFSHN